MAWFVRSNRKFDVRQDDWKANASREITEICCLKDGDVTLGGEVCYDRNTKTAKRQLFANLMWCWLLAVKWLPLLCTRDNQEIATDQRRRP